MTEPVVFRPLYMNRVWGGRSLATLYGRTLPDATTPVGESWEVVDRENEQSVVAGGPWAGTSLHELWRDRRSEVFGRAGEAHRAERFPLLLKILDARDTLSIQVHPPAARAASVGGDPKSELWFIAHAEPGACLYVGVKAGVGRAEFERALADGTVAQAVNEVPVVAGDSIFIPSGRLHAIGAGLVIFEIQQNSDTTYRVFDWNRVGLDGRPRALHVAESLACIDFTDTAPALNPAGAAVLAECPHFRVERHRLAAGECHRCDGFCLMVVAEGRLSWDGPVRGPGEFLLVPASAGRSGALRAHADSIALEVTLP